jgi:nitrate/TMAO reductase-like tetraheme cytochrome c subunit
MVAPNDCSLCHTTANWNSTTLPAGHMPNPGNQACAVCHTGAPGNYATMAGIAALHTGITNSCATCHGVTQLTFYNNNDNPKSAVLTPVHIPILSGTDCGVCHKANYVAGGFGPMNMTQASHASVSTQCITCHEKGLSFYMGAASPALQGRPADHTSGQMLAPNDCSLCHTTANWNSTTLPAGHMPNPGNQGCSVCHTAAPGNYTTLAANAVLHTGITSSCITCHAAPNAATKVFYNNFSPKSAVLSPVHIPSGSTACESCHAVSFTTFSGTTMSAAKHTALLAATGNTCDQCHDLKTLKFYGVTNLTTRPNGHHAGKDCNGCHTPRNWDGNAQKAPAKAVKAAVTSVVGAPAESTVAGPATGTASGPAGRRGVGANSPQLQATLRNLPSHSGVTSNCASCHNGTLATGRGPHHIQSDNTCQNCHTTLAWLPARFDHRGVGAACASCHNGALAAGKPPKHVASALDCSACHGVISWSVARFNHLGIGATCGSCHNGITAVGKAIKHMVTTQDCAGCHNTQSWDIVAPRPPVRPLLAPVRAKPGSPPQ